MSAMTMSPARISAGGSTSGNFGAPSVTVTPASIESPISSCESADRPEGRSIDDDGDAGRVHIGDDRLEQTVERRVQAGAEDRVDEKRAARSLRTHGAPTPGCRRLRRRRARDGRESRDSMRASPRTSATRPMRNTETSTLTLQRASGRRRSRRRRCCRGRTGCRPGGRRGRREWPPSPRRPGVPAFSMSTSDGMPTSSIVRRSASRIWAAVSTRILRAE